MSGPTKPFDPFGSASAAMSSVDTKAHAVSSSAATDSNFDSTQDTAQPGHVAADDSLPPAMSALASTFPSATAAADTTAPASAAHSSALATASTKAASFISPAAPKQTSGQPARHTSIFEIGGESISDHTPGAHTSRLGRIVGTGNGSTLSSTTSPASVHPLGSIMGSPHSLFNDSTYSTGQSHLPSGGSRGVGQAPPSAQMKTAPHRLSQSRFNSVLGDPALHSSGMARAGDKDASGNQSILDMGSGMLDTMKSQQASPSTLAQGGFNDFYVKSLPVSRRNSLEYQNLWQELEGFSINDNPVHAVGLANGVSGHLPALDGHSIAARNGSGAFRSDAAGSSTVALGTSPKLPHGLLDEDGMGKNGSARISTIGSTADLVSTGQSGVGAPGTQGMANAFGLGQASYNGYQRDPRVPGGAPNTSTVTGGQTQMRPMNGDVLHADAVHDLRVYDPSRNIGLIRNASTPVLNAKQYQVLQGGDEVPQMPSHPRGGPPSAGFADQNAHPRFDSPGLLYNTQYQGYAGVNGDIAYDMGGGRHMGGTVNYPYGGSASSGMMVGRTQSYVGSSSASGASTPMINNNYGMQSSFGPASVGMYGVGHQTAPPSIPPTPMQHAHHGASHIHMHGQQQQQALQSQRHGQQALASMAPSAALQSAPILTQGQGMHGQQKSGSGKAHRRGETEVNRFTNATLEELRGTIFDVCKDQYGCRFLQKKLEDGQEDHVEMILCEVLPHSSVLMIDPFGNYLCQKLLEHCNDKQRTQIIAGVSPDLVSISLNMHGTRAVQKIIELLSTQEQIDLVISALRGGVVLLIRDLNGNHVIQKCLSRLSSRNNQFIYDSVASSCCDVATHRHGCCVFQRCIDFAAESQKSQLVDVIISQALQLVQDPFGNYVVQYVLDLNVAAFSEPLIRKFVDHICGLSVQKFSSNVMEKCIRIASPATRKMLVTPLLQREKLDALMRDSYGNYVVQTALDFADQYQRLDIIEAIIPLLPLIRHTPYGKRIYIKLQRDGFVSAVPSAAGSRHASPTLGPSHGSHSTTAISSMSLYPQMGSTAPGSGSMASIGANLSRGVSPLAGANGMGASKPSLNQPRMFMPPANASGAFHHHQQQQQQQHMNGVYYYKMAAMDGAGATAHMYHAPMPMMAPAHPGSMNPNAHGAYESPPSMVSSGATPISVSAAPSSAPPGSSGAKLQASAYYAAH
ncbi:hypothetical protein GGH93_000830 [Coemansia aciculifera]|nr:hypothetical protein GGH93_000830 [Coemansia aciculifera]